MQSEMAPIAALHQKVEQMQHACATRDREMGIVRLVRSGHIDQLMPDLFADDLPKSVTGNTIDVAARDTAEMMAPLPALACASGNMTSQADENRASRKNKIGSSWWTGSRLEVQNIEFADMINSYSFGLYLVEPDFEKQCPRIRFESSFGAYYYHDRWGQLVWLAKVTESTVGEVCAMYPDKSGYIKSRGAGRVERSLNDRLKLVTYMDRDRTVVYLPDCDFVALASAPNPVGRVLAVVAERPRGGEARPRGQYDDVWPVQLARSLMAQYRLKAADKVVNSPTVLPRDVTDVGIGPDAVVYTDNPQGARRMPFEIPNEIFALDQELDRSLKEGSRYPEARTGGIKGNIVTGRGVQELMGTMDTQIKTMQTIIGHALEEVTSLCFALDEALWPNQQKKITGVLTGKPYELTYTPAKDIAGQYACRVTYGFAAGLSPAQALVALLQLRGDNLVGRDTVRRQLPFDVDPEEEQRAIDVQQMEDAAMQGLSALTQALGPMVMQGQDPLPVLLGLAKATQMRQKGTPVVDAIIAALTPPEEPAAPEAPTMPEPGQEQGGMPTELPPGIRPGGLSQGVPYGQAGAPPGGMPSIQALMSTLRGQGQSKMEASTLVKKAIA